MNGGWKEEDVLRGKLFGCAEVFAAGGAVKLVGIDMGKVVKPRNIAAHAADEAIILHPVAAQDNFIVCAAKADGEDADGVGVKVDVTESGLESLVFVEQVIHIHNSFLERIYFLFFIRSFP